MDDGSKIEIFSTLGWIFLVIGLIAFVWAGILFIAVKDFSLITNFDGVTGIFFGLCLAGLFGFWGFLKMRGKIKRIKAGFNLSVESSVQETTSETKKGIYVQLSMISIVISVFCLFLAWFLFFRFDLILKNLPFLNLSENGRILYLVVLGIIGVVGVLGFLLGARKIYKINSENNL